jgi:hypothetical protein
MMGKHMSRISASGGYRRLKAERERVLHEAKCQNHLECVKLWHAAVKGVASEAKRKGRTPEVVAKVYELERYKRQIEAEGNSLREQGGRFRIYPTPTQMNWPFRLCAVIAAELGEDVGS